VGTSTNDESHLEYSHLLNRVLEDRVIDQAEGEALVELALKWGLTVFEIEKLHERYISQLAIAAWDDGVVTEAENRDLLQVCELLGIDKHIYQKIFEKAKQQSIETQTQGLSKVNEFYGKSVCFTGECQCTVSGERVTRPMSYSLAEEHGMISAKGVTKKLDILVVADPVTQSGKAQKAKKYGTRIMQARVFWRALGLEVS
jgi:DNA polymerase-3 subunit epsilon